jgi:hypothetical protein
VSRGVALEPAGERKLEELGNLKQNAKEILR